jgi:uncharacterized protein (DUF4415 family)
MVQKMSKLNTFQKSETDWERFHNIKDEDIDLSDCPEATDEMWKNAVVRRNLKVIPKKTSLSLKIDTDVKEFFKSEGRGYQAKINQLLRAYMENAKKAG